MDTVDIPVHGVPSEETELLARQRAIQMAVPITAMQKTKLILQPAPATASTVDQAELTDEALMARIQKRDEEGLTMLYYRHGKLLRSVISRCVYDQQHSEDLLQEVFVEIWNRADHYSEEKGRAWAGSSRWLAAALDRVAPLPSLFPRRATPARSRGKQPAE